MHSGFLDKLCRHAANCMFRMFVSHGCRCLLKLNKLCWCPTYPIAGRGDNSLHMGLEIETSFFCFKTYNLKPWQGFEPGISY
jgi:hypothetical protein